MWWKYGLTYTAGVTTGIFGGFYYIQQEIQRDIDKYFSSNKSERREGA